jgi:hypothetical protein
LSHDIWGAPAVAFGAAAAGGVAAGAVAAGGFSAAGLSGGAESAAGGSGGESARAAAVRRVHIAADAPVRSSLVAHLFKAITSAE